MARVSPHGQGLGVATVIHHTVSGDTIQMPPVVWGEEESVKLEWNVRIVVRRCVVIRQPSVATSWGIGSSGFTSRGPVSDKLDTAHQIIVFFVGAGNDTGKAVVPVGFAVLANIALFVDSKAGREDHAVKVCPFVYLTL